MIEFRWRKAKTIAYAERTCAGYISGFLIHRTDPEEKAAVKFESEGSFVLQYRFRENPEEIGLQPPIWSEWQDVPLEGEEAEV